MNYDNVIEIVKNTDKIFFNDKFRRDVHVKGDCDFVTRADLEISSYIKSALASAYPNIGFISEEEKIESVDPRGKYWILDPIDGTTNYMQGLPETAVSLALFNAGDVEFAVVYVPYMNEFFYAQKGCGAFLNGKKIFCSDKTVLKDCLVAYELNPYRKDDHVAAIRTTDNIYLGCRDVRVFGSAVYGMINVSCGRTDCYYGRFLKPWDFSAAKLIVEEAGGKVSDTSGKIEILRRESCIVATNGKVHDEFSELLNK